MDENKTTPIDPTKITPTPTQAPQNTLDLSSFSIPVAPKIEIPAAPKTETAVTPKTEMPIAPKAATSIISKIMSSLIPKPKAVAPKTETPIPQTTAVVQKTETSVAPKTTLNVNAAAKIGNVMPTLTPQGTKPANNIINLEKLKFGEKIEEKEEKQKTNQVLASGKVQEVGKVELNEYSQNIKLVLSWYMIIIIAILGIVWISKYSTYLAAENQIETDPLNEPLISTIRDIDTNISKYTSINTFATWIERKDLLTNDASKKTAIETIKNEPTLNYTEKKIILKNNVNELTTDIINNDRKLENVKVEIEKFGFVPKELYEMTQKQDWIYGIRRALLLTESIKFITAFKVFGYMQSFLQWFSNDSKIDPKEAEAQLKALNENGEDDIITYTNNCYSNPYEVGDDCSITNDFDNYYAITKNEKDISPDFIKKIASYVDMKLREKWVPTYSIKFPQFDPKIDTIRFTTDINTNKQDELALNQIWIINPHLYIITNLINTLKQSLLVIWENIKIDQIRIVPKTVRVWSTIFTINNSNLDFSLPMQKTDQREISDFFNNKSWE